MRGSVVISIPLFGFDSMASHVNQLVLCSSSAERKRAPNKKTQYGLYLTNQSAVAVEVGVRTPLAAAEATGLRQFYGKLVQMRNRL